MGSRIQTLLTYLLLLSLPGLVSAVDPETVNAGEDVLIEDEKSYQLSVRDLVEFRIQDEPDTKTQERIDGNGRIRVPYIESQRIAGLSVRRAEHKIEKAYKEADIYIDPQASIHVLEYSPRKVSVLGEVKNPGTIQFPNEMRSMSIVSVISDAGGFTGIARSREVRVTRTNEKGEEEVHTVNVDNILEGQSGASFQIYPDDVIFVPERFF